MLGLMIAGIVLYQHSGHETYTQATLTSLESDSLTINNYAHDSLELNIHNQVDTAGLEVGEKYFFLYVDRIGSPIQVKRIDR